MGRNHVSRKPAAQFEVVPQTRKPVDIQARTPKQREYIRAIRENDITFGMGSAGTGKTFLAALMAMDHLTKGLVDKIVICRPAVEAGGEKLGFLPGGINEKLDPFLQPIFDAFRTYWSIQTIKRYIGDGIIEIVPLAFMRGRSFNRSFIVCDEAQNATPDNMLMLLTRLGEESKMVITGDPLQNDLKTPSSLHICQDRLRFIQEVEFVVFTENDVVRHPLVKKILRAWQDDPHKS